MERRTFLGTVIGLLLPARIPFIAEQVDYKECGLIKKYKHIIRAFEIDEDYLYKFKIVTTTQDTEFVAPSIKKIERTENSILFRAQDINIINNSINTKSCKLIDDQGYLLGHYNYYREIFACSGDSLRIECVLTLAPT